MKAEKLHQIRRNPTRINQIVQNHHSNTSLNRLFVSKLCMEGSCPFGMQIQNRTWEALENGYRFGFNGKERDDEISGSGNSLDFGARIYNSRLGEWLSVDPLARVLAGWSVYAFAGNSPITFYDPTGAVLVIYYFDENDNPQQWTYDPETTPPDNEFVNKVCKAIEYNMHTEKGTEVWTDLIDSELTLGIEEGQAINQQGAGGNSFTPTGTTSGSFDKDGIEAGMIGVITWDPDSQGEVKDDLGDGAFGVIGRHAPSTALLHEAGHAQEFNKALLNRAEDDDEALDNYILNVTVRDDLMYDNPEEKRNIIHVESIYLNQINQYQIKLSQENNMEPTIQPIRTNHIGYINYWDNEIGVNESIQHPDHVKYYKEVLEYRESLDKESTDGNIDH